MWRMDRRQAGSANRSRPEGITTRVIDSAGPIRQSPIYLAGFEGLAGLLMVLFAVFPPVADSNELVDAAIGTAFVVLGVMSALLVRHTCIRIVYDVSLVIAAVLIAGFSLASITPQRETLTALIVVSLGVLAGYYRSGVRLWLLLLWIVSTYGVALKVSDRLPSDIYIAFAGLVTVTLALMVSRLVSEIRSRATHDPLTGTLNRAGLVMSAEPIAAIARRSGEPVAVAIIDLDGFKVYNDRYGHLAGDQLLIELVTQWRSVLRGGDLLARFGGDEFVLVLTDAVRAEAEELGERMRALNPAPWSIGISDWAPGQELFDALKIADDRLYEAKKTRTHGA
jgi:diguanylate cyclase (GGDEF)-like protein